MKKRYILPFLESIICDTATFQVKLHVNIFWYLKLLYLSLTVICHKQLNTLHKYNMYVYLVTKYLTFMTSSYWNNIFHVNLLLFINANFPKWPQTLINIHTYTLHVKMLQVTVVFSHANGKTLFRLFHSKHLVWIPCLCFSSRILDLLNGFEYLYHDCWILLI